MDCLVLIVRVGGVNGIGDKARQFPIFIFSVVLNIFETKQLQIGNWVETRLNLNCLALSPVIQFTPPTRTTCLDPVSGTTQDKTVLSCVSGVK